MAKKKKAPWYRVAFGSCVVVMLLVIVWQTCSGGRKINQSISLLVNFLQFSRYHGRATFQKFLFSVLYFTTTTVCNTVGHCMGNLWWGGGRKNDKTINLQAHFPERSVLQILWESHLPEAPLLGFIF